MKTLSFVILASFLSLTSCSHMSKDHCDKDKKSCCKEGKCEKTGKDSKECCSKDKCDKSKK